YTAIGSIEEGSVYELRVIGTYSSGVLTMDMEVYDQEGTLLGTQRGVTDTAPLTGEYFGIRHREWSQSGALDIDYYRFSVTDEPLPPAVLPLEKEISLANMQPVRGGMFHAAADGLEFTVEVGGGRTIDASEIELDLNG